MITPHSSFLPLFHVAKCSNKVKPNLFALCTKSHKCFRHWSIRKSLNYIVLFSFTWRINIYNLTIKVSNKLTPNICCIFTLPAHTGKVFDRIGWNVKTPFLIGYLKSAYSVQYLLQNITNCKITKLNTPNVIKNLTHILQHWILKGEEAFFDHASFKETSKSNGAKRCPNICFKILKIFALNFLYCCNWRKWNAFFQVCFSKKTFKHTCSVVPLFIPINLFASIWAWARNLTFWNNCWIDK